MTTAPSRSLSRRAYAAAAVALAAVIFVALNLASNSLIRTARLDLTSNGQFTLSQGTRNTIAKVDEPITLRFFFSKQVTAKYGPINDYARRVRDLLSEYANLSGGKIKIEEIDPQPFTDAEDQADAAGIAGQSLETGEKVYFGLSGVNSIDGRATIAYFAPQREPYLEYDITSLVYRLSHPKKTGLAILTSLPLAGQQGTTPPFTIYSELSENYATQMLPADFSSIPAGVNVLLIAHPGPLTDAQSYVIDQFVLAGGRALIFVDPKSELAEASAARGGGQAPLSSDLGPLFKAWGVGYDPQSVVADKALALQVGSSGANATSYPVWIGLKEDQFNDQDTISASLQVMNLATAGALSPLKGATTKFVPLASSSNEAALLPTAELQILQPQDLMDAVKPTGQTYTLAARITGTAKSAYPQNGGRQSGNVNIVVVGDSDLLSDRFWVQTQDVAGQTIGTPFADNASLVLDGVENLSGSDDLISLRTRATRDRSFSVVRDIESHADEQFQQQRAVLQQKLQETQQRLASLEQGSGQSGNTITAAQSKEIDNFKRQLAETRTSLRQVERNLRKDIDALGDLLAFINVALVPLLVAAFAVVMTFVRRRRRAVVQRST